MPAKRFRHIVDGPRQASVASVDLIKDSGTLLRAGPIDPIMGGLVSAASAEVSAGEPALKRFVIPQAVLQRITSPRQSHPSDDKGAPPANYGREELKKTTDEGGGDSQKGLKANLKGGKPSRGKVNSEAPPPKRRRDHASETEPLSHSLPKDVEEYLLEQQRHQEGNDLDKSGKQYKGDAPLKTSFRNRQQGAHDRALDKLATTSVLNASEPHGSSYHIDSEHELPFFSNAHDDIIHFSKGKRATDLSSDEASDWRGLNSSPHTSSVANSETSSIALSDRSGGVASGERDRSERSSDRKGSRARKVRDSVERHMFDFDMDALRAEEARLRSPSSSAGSTDDDSLSGPSEAAEDDTSSTDSSPISLDAEGEERDEEMGEEGTTARAKPLGGFGIFARAPHGDPVGRRREAGAVSSSSASPPSSPCARRRRFGRTHYETHINVGAARPCHHTLLGLQGAITVEGPCVVIGLGVGEACLNGFYLRRRRRVLWGRGERAVLMPVRRVKGEAVAVDEPALRRELQEGMKEEDGRGVWVNPTPKGGLTAPFPLPTAAPTAADDADDADADVDADGGVEGVFGTIDWAWVRAGLRGWLQLFGHPLPAVVLVVQPYHASRYLAVRKHYLHPGGGPHARRQRNPRRLEAAWLRTATAAERARHAARPGAATAAYVEVPAFLSRHGDATAVVDAGLLTAVVPSVVREPRGAVIVLGTHGIGKSTLCRFLANALLSLHGRCFWLELDLGQPEFGVPGELALYRVRRPLRRPHDPDAAERLRGYFLGGPRVMCPLSTAKALAPLCELARDLAGRHPVVISTHGWVLRTGRRMTVEAIRRIRPRVVVHLLRPEDEAWAEETDLLLDPKEGLNAAVVGNRFLVRRFPGGRAPASGEKIDFLGKLPHAFFAQASPAKGGGAPLGGLKGSWKGIVHSVRVTREINADAGRGKFPKGRAGRGALWQAYLRPLIEHYESIKGEETTRRESEPTDGGNAIPILDAAPATVLLKAPLHALHRIVLVGRDEKEEPEQLGCSPPFSSSLNPSSPSLLNGARRQQHLAAMLEHSVVAVQLSSVDVSPALASPHDGVGKKAGSGFRSDASHELDPPTTQVVSLANLPKGFQVSCFGYIESTEQELLAGQIAIRLPIKRDVMELVMTKGISTGIYGASGAQAKGNAGQEGRVEASGTSSASPHVRISIAFSEAVQRETCFMEGYP